MSKRILATLMMMAGLLSLGACSSVTGPGPLKEFVSSPMPNPEALVPGAEATSALSVLYIQGLLQTPSPCYDLSGEFEKKGSKLTLRVHASRNSGTECDSGVGGFRYNAVVGDLARRSYQLEVIHTVEGGAGGEFNLTVTVVQ